MAKFKNNAGFTFVSVMFAFVLTILSMSLIMHLLQINNTSPKYEDFSINHFFYMIRNDVFRTEEYKVIDDTLNLELYNGKKLIISKYKDLIRKQVDFSGHEIYLRDVKKFVVDEQMSGFKIVIETLMGEMYEKRFILDD